MEQKTNSFQMIRNMFDLDRRQFKKNLEDPKPVILKAISLSLNKLNAYCLLKTS